LSWALTLDRNYLTGREGDKINAVLAAAGYNLRKLLRWLVFAPIFWLTGWLKNMLAVEIALRRAPNRAARHGFAPAVI